jgi:hypothetical protein
VTTRAVRKTVAHPANRSAKKQRRKGDGSS